MDAAQKIALLLLFLVITGFHDLSSTTAAIPRTLDGPFMPVTVPFDHNLRNASDDLPNDDPRFARPVAGFFPEQIALAQSVSSDSMYVSWITGEFQIGTNISQLNPSEVASVVEFGHSKHHLSYVAEGVSSVYSQLYPFQGLQNYTSGIIHHVKLTGLKPKNIYHYRCGDPQLNAMSEVFKFKTLPSGGPSSYPRRIAIVGDLGLTYNTTSTLQHLERNRPDLNIFLGDLSYANLYVTNGTSSACYSCSFKDTPIHETYQPRWDFWGRYLQPLRSRVPTMVIEGNHEFEEQLEKHTFVAYNARFAVPAEESGSFSKMYYSFNAGGAHFIMLGGYIAYHKSSEQFAWLEKDLAKVDRSTTPWLIAAFHPPWYSSYTAHYRGAECMRQSMEDLLYSNGVDVVLSGHVHAYERMNRVYNYSLDACAPLYITIGDGGNREKMAVQHADEPGQCPDPKTTPDSTGVEARYCGFNFTSGPAAGKFCWDRQPDWSAFRDSSFGHGILEIKNSTHALWTWHRNQDTYQSHHLGDQIYIVRQPKACQKQ